MAKRRVGSQSVNLILAHWKSKITLKYVHAGGVPHISLENPQQKLQLCFKPHLNQRFSQDIITFQSARCPNFKSFGTPNLGILGQNDIWMQPLWLITKNIIREKVVASPKSGPWWILWVYVCVSFVYAPKVFQLCNNQLLVWFVQVHVNNWSACHSS
jgi:hypothetical protein